LREHGFAISPDEEELENVLQRDEKDISETKNKMLIGLDEPVEKLIDKSEN